MADATAFSVAQGALQSCRGGFLGVGCTGFRIFETRWLDASVSMDVARDFQSWNLRVTVVGLGCSVGFRRRCWVP